MAKLFSDIRPGDLITASFMNQVLAEIQNLHDQLDQLAAGGPGGPPVINSISPGPLHVGDTITILGQNFGPLSSTVVAFAGTTVPQFEAGSGDSVLVVKIPTLFVSNQGTPTTLSITNPRGSVSTSINIFPALPTVPDGTLLLSLAAKSPAGNFVGNQSFNLTFRVKATLNMDEKFDVLSSVDVGWPAVFTDPTFTNPVVPSQVTIQKGASSATPVTVDIPIKLSIPNNPVAAGQLTLTVKSQRNPSKLFQSFVLPVPIGSAPVVSDKISPSVAFVGTNANWDGTTVLVPAGGQLVAVPFSVFLVDHGEYVIKVPPLTNDPLNLWNVKLFTASGVTTTQDNTTFTGIAVTITALANAAPNSFILRVESKANPTIATELPVPIKLKT
jgi:hypothetical protein